MSRSMLHAFVLTIVLGTMDAALAQVPRNAAPSRPTASASKFIVIPGLPPLSMGAVQREIGLSAEQKQQLKAVSDVYMMSMQKLHKSFEELTPEEQEKQGKVYSDRDTATARNAQHKAEAVLTPAQLKTVQKIAFQLSAAGAMSNPALQEKVGLTAEQRQKLNAVYEKAGEKMQQLQRDTAEQVMQLLDEEQAAELKKQMQPQKQQ